MKTFTSKTLEDALKQAEVEFSTPYQELAYKVCHRSIKKYNKTINIHKLNKKDL